MLQRDIMQLSKPPLVRNMNLIESNNAEIFTGQLLKQNLQKLASLEFYKSNENKNKFSFRNLVPMDPNGSYYQKGCNKCLTTSIRRADDALIFPPSQ